MTLGNRTVLWVAAWMGIGVTAGATPPLDRVADPVVLCGADLTTLLGEDPTHLVAFRYDSGWVQIPVQVDERAVVDFGTIYGRPPSGLTVRTYVDAGTFTGADPDPTFDTDDELVVMAIDAGGSRAGVADPPEHVDPAAGVEVEIRDPLDGARAWVYLFPGDGTLDPAAGAQRVDYVFHLLSGDYKTTYNTAVGPNPENSVVTTPSYGVRFSDRWIRDETRVTAGSATGVDILDRHKTKLRPRDCSRTEQTFSSDGGALIVNRSGPLRAIRGYIGANSGITTHRIHAFYEAREDVRTFVRVHSIPGIMDLFDYSPGATGMRYYNDFNVAGATIDGSPDPVSSAPQSWEMVTGAQGTLAMTVRVVSDIPALAWVGYYSDSLTPLDTQCTGDAWQYGESGIWVPAAIPNTDPAGGVYFRLELTRVIRYAPPGQPPAFAARSAEQVDSPPVTSVAPWPPAVCPDDDGDGYALCAPSCQPPGGATCGDNCPSTANPDQADLDEDGEGNACDGDDDGDGTSDAEDCAPLDPSAARLPTEVEGFRVDKSGDGALSWTSQGPGFRYDLVTGDLLALRNDGTFAGATCLKGNVVSQNSDDPTPAVPPGGGVYFLVRARNACARGTYGLTSEGAPRTIGQDCP